MRSHQKIVNLGTSPSAGNGSAVCVAGPSNNLIVTATSDCIIRAWDIRACREMHTRKRDLERV